MAACKSREKLQWRHNQQCRTQMSTAPSYSHEGEDAGDDSKRTDSIVHGFKVITVASPDTVPPFSDVTPSCISFRGWPRTFGPSISIIGETVGACVTSFWTENSNAQLELPAPCFLCDYDIDVLETTEDARFLPYPEPIVSNANVRNKNGTHAVRTDGGVDGGDCGGARLLLNATNNKSNGDVQLDQTTVGHDPIWESFQHAHACGHDMRNSVCDRESSKGVTIMA
ncbi:uncharacterized protein LOC125941738 [Dermacentor silvarum]|uniref:uncharacterized protein LOC125941738 n=1 Tax=Dermacentor silvarum TaxID=543639 RepID=UPI002101B5B7|nr:uncharacterized protein LOC125941738 [Dermacentor silvarum]